MKQELLRRLTRERWDIRDGILKTGYREQIYYRAGAFFPKRMLRRNIATS